LAIDRLGNVYVSEVGNDRVQVFDPQGNFLAALGSGGSAAGQFDNLHGLVVDSETDMLYVADTGNNRVQVFKIIREPNS
jgi:tripartite motif-containing protein 71